MTSGGKQPEDVGMFAGHLVDGGSKQHRRKRKKERKALIIKTFTARRWLSYADGVCVCRRRQPTDSETRAPANVCRRPCVCVRRVALYRRSRRSRRRRRYYYNYHYHHYRYHYHYHYYQHNHCVTAAPDPVSAPFTTRVLFYSRRLRTSEVPVRAVCQTTRRRNNIKVLLVVVVAVVVIVASNNNNNNSGGGGFRLEQTMIKKSKENDRNETTNTKKKQRSSFAAC